MLDLLATHMFTTQSIPAPSTQGLNFSPNQQSWFCGLFEEQATQGHRSKLYASTAQHSECGTVLLRVLDNTKGKLYTLHAQPLNTDAAVLGSSQRQPSLSRGVGKLAERGIFQDTGHILPCFEI